MKSFFTAAAVLMGFATTLAGADLSVMFSVSDKSGSAVPGLTARDFILRIDGKERPISRVVDASSLPLTLIVLVDVSGSTVDTPLGSQELVDFFQLFIRRGQDKCAILSFASTLTIFQDFTDDASKLGAAVEGVSHAKAGGPTAVYDAVHFAAEILGRVPTRKAILLISDGEDTSSRHSRDEMRQGLLEQGVLLYAISIPRTTSRQSSLFGRQTEAGPRLSEDVADSGGIMFTPSDKKALASGLDRLGANLHSFYAATYNADGIPAGDRPRKIRITTSRKGLIVRHPAVVKLPLPVARD